MKLELESLAGILHAQKRIDNLIPVISARCGLLQEVEARVKSLSREECIELMNALIQLQSHCRAVGMAELMLSQ